MANALFDIYSTSILNFTRTLVVKFSPTAEAINTGLSRQGFQVDPYDQSTWKYYQNLSGEYHETDEEMYIVSLDRPEDGEQLFDKALLADNKLTRDLYIYGTRYYNELVAKYPGQVNLINGIIYPVDKAAAIAADDGDVLWYDDTLVEENEDNLVPSLEEWIKRMLHRWCNYDYARVENLSWPAWLAVLYSLMPGFISSVRLENCKTPFAHSHHIRQYLESHGRLGEFIPYLNKKQMLWLYRNIDYVRSNAGISSTFDSLVDIVLTERGLPLSEFRLTHSTAEYRQDGFPVARMERRPVSFTQSGTGSDVRDIEVIVRKESDIAHMDEAEILYQTDKIEKEASRSSKADLPTKVLESAVVDRTDAVAFPLSDVLFNHWQYMAAVDDYRARMNITLPISGTTLILTAREALILWAYCISKITSNATYDPVYETIPTAMVRNIRRKVDPTFEELSNVVDSRDVSEEEIRYAMETDFSYGIIYDTDTFYQTCVLIQKELMRHYELYATREDLDGHAQCAYMVSLFYFDQEVEMDETGETYAAWFSSKGIDFTGMTDADFLQLATNLMATATGAGENASKTLRETHAAMIRLFTRLSSYSIQVLRSINNSNEIVLNTPPLRWSKPNYATKVYKDNVRVAPITVIDAGTRSHVDTTRQGMLETGIEPIEATLKSHQRIDMFTGVSIEVEQTRTTYNDVTIPTVGIIEPLEGVVDLDSMNVDDVEEYTYPD